MTIRNKDHFMESLWDWKCLEGCFGGTRISPTDIDGLVEVNGNFLLLEAKSANAEPHMGQRLTFNALVNTGLFTVLVIYGSPGMPERMQVWPCPAVTCDLEDLRMFVECWYSTSKAETGEAAASQRLRVTQ
jgi:hypothetical protein